MTWRPAFAGVVLKDRLFTDWRVRLACGRDSFSDQLIQLAGSQASGSTCPQLIKQIPTGYASYTLYGSGLWLTHHAIGEAEDNSWIDQELYGPPVDRLVLVAPRMSVTKLLYAFRFIEKGGQSVAIVTESMAAADFKQAAPWLSERVLWFIPERCASQLMHAETQHPGLIGSPWALERAELGAKLLGDRGCKVVVLADTAGAAFVGADKLGRACRPPDQLRELNAPWRPYEDFYRLALTMVAGSVDHTVVTNYLAATYHNSSVHLANQKQDWVAAMTRSLL